MSRFRAYERRHLPYVECRKEEKGKKKEQSIQQATPPPCYAPLCSTTLLSVQQLLFSSLSDNIRVLFNGPQIANAWLLMWLSCCILENRYPWEPRTIVGEETNLFLKNKNYVQHNPLQCSAHLPTWQPRLPPPQPCFLLSNLACSPTSPPSLVALLLTLKQRLSKNLKIDSLLRWSLMVLT